MCGCASTKKVNNKSGSTLSSSGNFAPQEDVNSGELATTMVQVEYVGPLAETFTINSRVDRSVRYRFGNNETHKRRTVFFGDAEYLTGLRDGNEKPLWMMLSSGPEMESRDPAAFLAAPVAA